MNVVSATGVGRSADSRPLLLRKEALYWQFNEQTTSRLSMSPAWVTPTMTVQRPPMPPSYHLDTFPKILCGGQARCCHCNASTRDVPLSDGLLETEVSSVVSQANCPGHGR